MANLYFDPTTVEIAAGTRALAAQVNSVSQAISAGFDKLPTETEFKLGLTRYAVDTGVADAYIVTLPYVPVLTDGFNLTFKAVNANTGPATINVNGTGVKSIVNPDGTALVAGAFGANAIIIIAYESVGDRYILVSQNPAQAAQAAASAAAAAVSEANAATSETNAATSEANALTSENNAAASYDSFDDRYLGPKASAPTLDNDGDPLINGALYWNTTDDPQRMYGWDGTNTVWQPVFASGDATTLGGLSASQFLRSDADDSFTGTRLTVDGILDIAPAVTQIYMGGTDAEDGNPATRLIIDTSNSDHDWYLSRGIQYVAGNWELATAGVSPAGVFFNTDATNNGIAILAAGNHNSLAAGATFQRPEDFSPGAAVRITGLTGFIDMTTNGTTRMRIGDADTQIDDLRVTGTVNFTSGDFLVDHDAITTDQMTVTANAALTSGDLFDVTSNLSTKTGTVARFVQDHASSAAVLATFQQDGTGIALDIDHNGTGGNSISILHNSAADAVNISTNDGNALAITANDAAAKGIEVVSGIASRTQPLVDINNTNATGTGTALNVTQNQGAAAISSTATNAGARGLNVYSNISTRTVPLVTVNNDNSVNGGLGVEILQDASGNALDVRTTNAAGRAAYFFSGTASRTEPVVEIINTSPTGTGVALEVINDQSGPSILATNTTSGFGIQATSTSSDAGYFQTTGAGDAGVNGLGPGSTNSGYGVRGQQLGTGVTSAGVMGESLADKGGKGVWGIHRASATTVKTGYGVVAEHQEDGGIPFRIVPDTADTDPLTASISEGSVWMDTAGDRAYIYRDAGWADLGKPKPVNFSAGGVTEEFVAGGLTIPPSCSKVTIFFYLVSTNGSSRPLLQLEYSGTTWQTSLYTSEIAEIKATPSVAGSTTEAGILISDTWASGRYFSGKIELMRREGTNTWFYSWHGASSNGNHGYVGAGYVTLSGELSDIRLNTTNGTDSYQSGQINVYAERF